MNRVGTSTTYQSRLALRVDPEQITNDPRAGQATRDDGRTSGPS